MLRGIYSDIYGEDNVSVSGVYMLQYAGGTRASSCFIIVTLKFFQAGNFWTLLHISLNDTEYPDTELSVVPITYLT